MYLYTRTKRGWFNIYSIRGRIIKCFTNHIKRNLLGRVSHVDPGLTSMTNLD